MLNKVVFYKNEVIFAAKEEIFSFCNGHPVKRKVTNEHPNRAAINVKDIPTLLDCVPIPSFVTAIPSFF